MTTQEPKKRGRKPKAVEPVTQTTEPQTLQETLARVELLAGRRTDKEAKALLTGISMGLNHALGNGVLTERSGRFYLTGTDEL